MTTIFDGLAASARGDVIVPGDACYDEIRAVWNGSIDRHPAAILRCTGVADVRAGVRFAREHDLLLAVRAGGHNIAGLGTCDAGLVLDLRHMREVHVDPSTRIARAQTGATWGVFDAETQARGLATTGGVMSTTGVAGFTLGGGIGWLQRKYGTAVDNVRSIDLVTADGTLINASADREPELFWGVRGGGGNFGVATSIAFDVVPLGPTVAAGPLIFPLRQAREALRSWARIAPDLPDEAMSIAILRTAPPDPPFPSSLFGEPVLYIASCWAGGVADGLRGLDEIRAIGTPEADAITERPYLAFQASQDRYWEPGADNYWKADYLRDLDDSAIDALVGAAENFTSPQSDIKLGLMGGAVSRVPENSMAYGHRSAQFLLNINTRWTDGSAAERHITWTRSLWTDLHRLADGVYVNFLSDEGADRVREAYGPDKYARLQHLKAAWDPDNLFRVNQNIPPLRR
jgi:FAD/FMN-containing dehydrogenase